MLSTCAPVQGGALVMQVPLKRRSALRCPSPVLVEPPICIALLASCHQAWDPVPSANEYVTTSMDALLAPDSRVTCPLTARAATRLQAI